MDYEPHPLIFEPGLRLDISPYAAKGKYVGGFNVRFYQGMPEKIGGWAQALTSQLDGPARGVHAWTGLDGTRYVAWGTANKLWVMEGNTLHDITPVGMPAGNVDGADSYAFGQSYWGGGPWGGANLYFTSPTQPRTWTLGNWGEDLIACYRGGPLYLWDRSVGTGTPAAIVPTAPASMLTFWVSETNRYLIALGAQGGPIVAGSDMTVAWCNREDLTNWTASVASTAGDKRLEIGSIIVASVDTRLGRLILTDAAAYMMRYIGPPYIFSITKIGEGHDAPVSPNAIIARNGIAYWMGPQSIMSYGGTVEPARLTSPINSDLYASLNRAQAFKCWAGINKKFGEVTFFYPDIRDGSVAGRENSRCFSVNDDGWSRSFFGRTSWLDENVSTNYPVATDAEGRIHFHEVGVDGAGTPLPFELETGEVEMGNGGSFIRTRRLIPDYQRITGSHTVTLSARRFPMDSEVVTKSGIVTPTSRIVPIQLRGRSMRMRISGDTLGADFRLGTYRAAIRAHGGR